MNYNPQIAFVCDLDLPNYLTNPSAYDYLEGKHSATGYYYWILKNAGKTNVHLVMPEDPLDGYDAVVIYYENRKALKNPSKYKVIQVVSDRPQIEGCDLYIACNQSVLNLITKPEYVKMVGLGLKPVLKGKWHFIHYPMAVNYKKCNPVWPPRTYHFAGRDSTLLPELSKPEFIQHLKNKGINLRFDFYNDHNHGDEDVYFCVRNTQKYFSTICNGNNVDTALGQKTANRLYQAWKMGVPSIFNPSTAMLSVRQSEYDFLIASDVDEFEYQCLRLYNDSMLFEKMIGVCRDRSYEHSNEIIVRQWDDAIDLLFHKY